MYAPKNSGRSRNVIQIDDIRKRKNKGRNSKSLNKGLGKENGKSQSNRASGRSDGERGKRPRGRVGGYVLLSVIILLVLFFVMGLEFFVVKQVSVSGADTIAVDEVIRLSGVQMGENMFKLNTKLMIERIESAQPLLQVKKIVRKYPDILSIEVLERKPRAVIQQLDGYYILNEEGFVLGKLDNLPVGSYPLLVGLQVDSMETGQQIVADKSDVVIMNQIIKALYDMNAVQYVGEIDISNRNDIRMISREGIIIQVGLPESLPYKLGLVEKIIPELRTGGYLSGVLYLTSDNGASFRASSDTVGQITEQESADEQTGEGGDDEEDPDSG